MNNATAAVGWPASPNPTQAHVVERARYCLRHGGGAEVSLTEISRAAHHSPSTLIYQFGSYAGLKDSVFTDIVLELAERIHASARGHSAVVSSAPPEAASLINAAAKALREWVTEEPEAAEFVVRHMPTNLGGASSDRSVAPLRSLAALLLPSLSVDQDSLARSVPVLHQGANTVLRFAQAAKDDETFASFFDTALAAMDTAAGLLDG